MRSWVSTSRPKTWIVEDADVEVQMPSEIAEIEEFRRASGKRSGNSLVMTAVRSRSSTLPD
jgi:hypothetical protein